EAEVRHDRAWLVCGWILEPGAQVRRRVGHDAARDRRSTAEVGQVRTDFALRGRALDCVTARAATRLEQLRTLLGWSWRRSGGRLLLRREPRLEIGRSLHEGAFAHVAVRIAAQLIALARELAHAVRRQPDVVGFAREGVALATQRWHPERMDHIVRFQVQV